MSDADSPTVVLAKARGQVGAARKELTHLWHKISYMNATAKEIARSELCSALIRRLEIAETELVELENLMND